VRVEHASHRSIDVRVSRIVAREPDVEVSSIVYLSSNYSVTFCRVRFR
jgi:hypothetical protein